MASNDQQDSVSKEKDGSALARYALCLFSSLYTFAFVGALFGWGPMQRMLEGSGAFSYMCPSSSTVACSVQSQTIVNIGFMAVTFSIVTPLIGHAIDHYGAATVAYGMSTCGIVGSGLIVVAAATQTSWLYWICFALLALTTFSGSLLSVQVGLFFHGHTQVRVIMWLNALFDAGSVTYLLLWMIEGYLGANFAVVALVYFGVAILLFVPASYFWTITVPQDLQQHEHFAPGETESFHTADGVHPDTADEVARSETTAQSLQESLRLFMESKMDPSILKDVVDSRRGSLRPPGGSVAISSSVPLKVIYGAIPETDDSGERDNGEDVLVAERSAKEQLFSGPFISLTVFFAISMISCTWSLMTAADFLASLGDDGTYLKIFTLMQPASILCLPLVDAIVRFFGFGAAFQAVNSINFIYIFIKCTSTNLNVQIVTFFAVAAVRCFLYATTYSFLPSLLSADVVGRGTGLISFVGGIASFMNIPLNSLASSGDFLTPNLIYLVAVIPCTIAAYQVQGTIRRENEIKNARLRGAAVRVSLM